jgi:choline dehydrogenase-like flavoprotein
MTSEKVDVLIVGAGASGAAFAWSMADTRMRILCLEQGDWSRQSDYPSNSPDWESREDFHFDPNVRARVTDYPINVAESAIRVANFNGVGGGTILYAGHFPRMHPADFRTRTLDGVGDDWPIDYATLEPYYNENDRITGVAGLTGDPAYPPKQPQMPPVPLGRSGALMARAFNSLGWHWWPSDCAINTQAYEGRDKCINLGACCSGCSQGAKASTDITYWPLAQRAGVELRTRCRVREITVGKDGMATGVIYFDAGGNEHWQEAEVVVLACNGIGTPRLLLNSRSASFPDGLANSSGLVGRNLMFHPYASVEGVFDEPLDGARGPHKSISSHQFCDSDPARGFARGFSFEMHRGRGPVNTVVRAMLSGQLPWGEAHHRSARELIDRVTGVVAVCEDLPELHNSVTLDPVLKDSNGVPAPKISYKLSENSLRMLDFAVKRGEDVMRAAGARRIEVESPMPYAGWHLMGTARMGVDPSKSVTNEWGRCHDVRNLFIIDGSIFVTSAAVNPTSTIQAIALYVADSIKRRLDNLFD